MSNAICPSQWAPGILCDSQIEWLVYNEKMISPFIPRQVKENGIVSYGLSSYGYDVRISNEFKIISELPIKEQIVSELIQKGVPFDKLPSPTIIDPTDLDDCIFEDFEGPEIIIPPHGFILGRTIETVDIPRDVMIIALAKSTWARVGLLIGVTPVESGFQGTVTIELSNSTDLPIRIKAGHGICQFLFLKGSDVCDVSYADRAGKYMGQVGVTLPKVIT